MWCLGKEGRSNESSDLTKQYYKTSNSLASDEMFNSMYNKQMADF